MQILESALYAEDLEAARSFYEGILGLQEITYDASRHLFLRLETSVLLLFRASKTVVPDADVPPHGTVGHGHLAFSATPTELDDWKKRLKDARVPVISEIEWPNGARSIYFNDPAGNVLEFATRNLWFRT